MTKNERKVLVGFDYEDPKACLEAVKQNCSTLQYVRNQTEKICLEAVKQNGYALAYVRNQTEEICLEAVKQDYDALQYVNDEFLYLFDEEEHNKKDKKEA